MVPIAPLQETQVTFSNLDPSISFCDIFLCFVFDFVSIFANEITKLFPNLFGKLSASFVPSDSGLESDKKLKIGVVLSGGQAPEGHNVISGIFDYLHDRAKGSTLYEFKGGPAGIMKCKYVELTSELIYPYRNQGGFDMICSGRDKIETPEQFEQAEETAVKLDLDGLVVIGGDDSNTNACLLAKKFRGKNVKTRVIGCPKTIDGDLKCKEVPTSFGFDTACKVSLLNIVVELKKCCNHPFLFESADHGYGGGTHSLKIAINLS